MRTSTPDETGWYWLETKRDGWFMAYVDANEETIYILKGDSPPALNAIDEVSLDTADHDLGAVRWFGPILCPGGPFGGSTIIINAERHDEAERQQKAIVLRHVDFRHLKDERSGASVTVDGLYTRAQALPLIDVDLLGKPR